MVDLHEVHRDRVSLGVEPVKDGDERDGQLVKDLKGNVTEKIAGRPVR